MMMNDKGKMGMKQAMPAKPMGAPMAKPAMAEAAPVAGGMMKKPAMSAQPMSPEKKFAAMKNLVAGKYKA